MIDRPMQIESILAPSYCLKYKVLKFQGYLNCIVQLCCAVLCCAVLLWQNQLSFCSCATTCDQAQDHKEANPCTRNKFRFRRRPETSQMVRLLINPNPKPNESEPLAVILILAVILKLTQRWTSDKNRPTKIASCPPSLKRINGENW